LITPLVFSSEKPIFTVFLAYVKGTGKYELRAAFGNKQKA
jgi:hypothetical protein